MKDRERRDTGCHKPSAETDVVSTDRSASAADADDADGVAAAPTTNGRTRSGRGAILVRPRTVELRIDELAETLTREEGKPLTESGGEYSAPIAIFHYYAEKARDFAPPSNEPCGGRAVLQTEHRAVGVAALISPWNYPLTLLSGRAPALRPATQSSQARDAGTAVGAMIVEALTRPGFRDGA